MWGFSQVLLVNTFKDRRNGYLYDGDHCKFGVGVNTPFLFETSELFTVTDNFRSPTFTWMIRGLSTLLENEYLSDVFSNGGRNWHIQVNPSGRRREERKDVSMYLRLNAKEKFRPYEKIYVRAKLRVLNQRKLNNIEKLVEVWFTGPGTGGEGWGYDEFISLVDLRDSSKGFLVNDMLIVQAELEVVSSTKYYP